MTIFFRIVLVFVALCSITTSVKAQINTLSFAQNTLSDVSKIVNATETFVNNADETFRVIKEKDLYKSLIDGKEFKFPIGILPADLDPDYALGIRSIALTPAGMKGEIYMKIPIGDKHLYFLADNVPFDRSGGLNGDLTLYLLRSDSITVGKGYTIVFKGLEKGGIDQSCFVTFNCKGFKEATLTGQVKLNEKAVVKDAKTKQTVAIDYYTNADKLSNFVVDLKNIPSFEFTSLPGFKVTVPSITLDKSDLRNAPRFQLPAWYTSKAGLPAVVGYEWEGLYIPSIEIDIPAGFKRPNEQIAIYVQDLIIDQEGVSMQSEAVNVLEGSIKTWEYSIDRMELDLFQNALSKGAIHGMMTLPISKKESKVKYSLAINNDPITGKLSYDGSIETGEIDAQAFGIAKINLQPSVLNVNYTDQELSLSAVLTGSVTVSVPKRKEVEGEAAFARMGMAFKKLTLSTKAPYLFIPADGYFVMGSEGSLISNFPVEISDVEVITADGGQRFGVSMNLTVHLQPSEDGSSSGFDGTANFTLWTKRDASSQKWKFDGAELNEIDIESGGEDSPYWLKGNLKRFSDDAVYHNGFCGSLTLKLIDKIEVKAAAIFGRHGQIAIDPNATITDASMQDSEGEYRYWFVDAAATFPAVAVAPLVGLNGITGGLYHYMKLEKTVTGTKVDCKTASGMSYVPSKLISLGLIAGVGLQSMPTDAVFNGNVTLSMEFFRGGGINMIAIWGEVGLLTPPIDPKPEPNELKAAMDQVSVPSESEDKIKEEEPKNDASIRVKWFTKYSFPEKTFIGDFDVFVNVKDIVTGIGANNKAGHIAVLFSPTEKYVYMGTPSDQLGVNVAKLFECSAYFCAGNKLPDPPIAEMPSEVRVLNPPSLTAMDNGSGLAFGARVGLDRDFGGDVSPIDPCSFGLSAHLWAKAGFDVLITRSNGTVYCDGSPRGIHNWYATGQAFIVGGLKVGLDYDCLKKGSIDLVNATLSTYIFAQLPKPSYVKGNASLSFSILDDLYSGSVTVKVEIGEQCNGNSSDKNFVFISSILPDSAATGVKVTEPIIVNFSKAIELFKFQLPDESSSNGGNLTHWGYVGQNEIRITCNNKSLPFSMEWNKNKTTLRIVPLTVLPEDAFVKVEIAVKLMNSKGGSGDVTERRTITFNTIIESEKIEVSDVAYAYPLPDMTNYHKSEYNTGFVKLHSLPLKPMVLKEGYNYNVVFKQGSLEVARITNVTVDNRTNVEQFVYLIPNDKLENNKSYTFMLCKTPTTIQTKTNTDTEYKTEQGYEEVGKEIVVLEYSFKTSRFSSFSQKMAYYNQSEVEVSGVNVVNTLSPNSSDKEAKTMEDFSKNETEGYTSGDVKTTEPMLRSLGADFGNGFAFSSGAPTTVTYSFYSKGLAIQYDVFKEIDKENRDRDRDYILCTVDGLLATCNDNATSVKNTTALFPKADYYYKLGYFIPGRNIKTSEVLRSFTLTEEIKLSY